VVVLIVVKKVFNGVNKWNKMTVCLINGDNKSLKKFPIEQPEI